MIKKTGLNGLGPPEGLKTGDAALEQVRLAVSPLDAFDLCLWQQRVQLLVRPKRYQHICRVAELAQQIALGNGLSPCQVKRAFIAGVLHDIARDLPEAELLRLAPPECAIDQAHPLALHGRAGRVLLEHWGYHDPLVLEAVEDHTTGPRDDSVISACVYIADVSEPGRGVNEDIRALALSDLGAALNRAIVSKVTYLQGRGIQVHPRTLQAYQALPPVQGPSLPLSPCSEQNTDQPLQLGLAQPARPSRRRVASKRVPD